MPDPSDSSSSSADTGRAKKRTIASMDAKPLWNAVLAGAVMYHGVATAVEKVSKSLGGSNGADSSTSSVRKAVKTFGDRQEHVWVEPTSSEAHDRDSEKSEFSSSRPSRT